MIRDAVPGWLSDAPPTRVLVESARQLVGLDAAVKVREALVVLLRPAVDLILERLQHLLEAFQPDPDVGL